MESTPELYKPLITTGYPKRKRNNKNQSTSLKRSSSQLEDPASFQKEEFPDSYEELHENKRKSKRRKRH